MLGRPSSLSSAAWLPPGRVVWHVGRAGASAPDPTSPIVYRTLVVLKGGLHNVVVRQRELCLGCVPSPVHGVCAWVSSPMRSPSKLHVHGHVHVAVRVSSVHPRVPVVGRLVLGSSGRFEPRLGGRDFSPPFS